MDRLVDISDQPLDVAAIQQYVHSGDAGAVNIFVGTVRKQTKGREVVRLEFESYDAMAIREMGKIIKTASEKWLIQKMAVVHRKGVLTIGDVAVVIAVSTPHRKASFEACQYAIDTLKETVPIWKKEVFEDGEVWVAAHP